MPIESWLKSVDCNNFQSAKGFLDNGGEKGKQLGMLTAGKYRINTRLFQVSTTPVTVIPANAVGVVTTLWTAHPLRLAKSLAQRFLTMTTSKAFRSS
jgi:hypothetical protein